MYAQDMASMLITVQILDKNAGNDSILSNTNANKLDNSSSRIQSFEALGTDSVDGFVSSEHVIQIGQNDVLSPELEEIIASIEDKVIAWRRDIHEHPELGNREFRTAALVADHLRSLGIAVQTEVAHTGVVGVLTGGRPGPVVALRADMDALPVTERVDIPFASKVKTMYEGQ